MRAPSTAPRRIARLRPWLLALAPLACTPDEPVESDDRVAVKLTFDEVTYFEGATAPRKVLERVKNQTRSIFPALRKADVLVLTNQQVDIEPNQLKREPISVVDPATGAARQGVRVRFHYVTLAQVPKALADRGQLALGVLHGGDGAHAEAVLGECSANGERERGAVSELWTVFDASLPSCAEAMAREQAAIDAARKKLGHPDREIVPAELERVYLPLAVHVRRRQRADAGDYALPAEGAHVDNPGVKMRLAPSPAAPAAPAGPVPEDQAPTVVYIDKSEEKQFEESDDDKELRKQARAMGGDVDGPVAAPQTNFGFSSSTYLAPNYAILYLAIIAFVVLLVGQQRRHRKR